MKVILKEPVQNLGIEGDVVAVSAGYARNYLLPKKLALPATPANIKLAESFKRKLLRKKAEERKTSQELAEKLEGLSIAISRLSGENDQLFGSVTASDIVEALAVEGVVIDKKQVILPEPLKALGIYNIEVTLSHDITATLKVWVVSAKEKEEK